MNEITRPKVKNFMRYYENEEIESLNFIFGKSNKNNWFTQEELSFACDFDLMDKENLEQAKIDWMNNKLE